MPAQRMLFFLQSMKQASSDMPFGFDGATKHLSQRQRNKVPKQYHKLHSVNRGHCIRQFE